MRVLMTTDTVGGVWTFTQELTQGVLGAGCHVALVSVGPSPSQVQTEWTENVRTAWGSRFQFTALNAPLEWMQGNEEAFSAAVPALLRLIEAFQPEVIHSSQFCFGAIATSLPIIITAHSDVLSWGASCPAKHLDDSPWLRRYSRLVREGLHKAAAIVAPTQWMMQALGANFLLPALQEVIPNGRKLPHASASQRKLQAVVCGRLWDEGKNVQMLAHVRSCMPILVAGETSGENASTPCDVGTATLLGFLPEAELLVLLRESAIYVCTSRYEPFGLAPLEAAVCGCAILANDIPSLREVWGEAALYFSGSESLSALLTKLAADADLLAESQSRCSNRALCYTREAMTSRYLALYSRQVRARKSTFAA